jgi:aminopeptidase YwaD
LTGATKPDELVLFSAHNDSTYSSPGAADDGGGVACVMELARAFSKGPRLARTLRFIAWGAEELGLIGSEMYLRSHASETAKTVAMINYDGGLGSALGTVGWTAAGADDWVRFLHDTFAPLKLEERSSLGASGTDSTNFGALEVPAINFSQRGGNGGSHTPADNLQQTNAEALTNGLLLAATLGERLAMDPNLNFSHHFPPELLQTVRDYAARWGWGVRREANLEPKK